MASGIDLGMFPSLQKWAEDQWAINTKPMSHGEFLLLEACRVMAQSEGRGLLWTLSLKKFVHRSQDIEADLRHSIGLARDFQCDFVQIFANLTEAVVTEGNGLKIFAPLKKISDDAQIVTFRFLTAWTAFNNNQYEQCLEECEPIMDRYHYVYHLAAQALIYMGRNSQAAEMLGIATQLAPYDGDGWFLLAKNFLLLDDLAQCLNALEKCLEIIPKDLEVYSLALLAGCHPKATDDQRKRVFEINKVLIKDRTYPNQIYLKLLENCSLIEDSAILHQALQIMDATRWELNLQNTDELQNLAALLKNLYLKGDSKGSTMVLDFVKVAT